MNADLTRGNQDLLFLGANAHKGEVILRVNISDCAPRQRSEAAKKSCIKRRCGVIQSCSDGKTFKKDDRVTIQIRSDCKRETYLVISFLTLSTFWVYNNCSNYTFMPFNPLQSLFNISLWKKQRNVKNREITFNHLNLNIYIS